jgi:hypothetical protein
MRSCATCHHAERDDIEAKIYAGVPFYELADEYGMSAMALCRHKRSHMAPKEGEPAPEIKPKSRQRPRKEVVAVERRSLAVLSKQDLAQVISELALVAPSDVLQWEGGKFEIGGRVLNLKGSDEISRAVAIMVQEIDFKADGGVKLKMRENGRVLEMLMRHFGLGGGDVQGNVLTVTVRDPRGGEITLPPPTAEKP